MRGVARSGRRGGGGGGGWRRGGEGPAKAPPLPKTFSLAAASPPPSPSLSLPALLSHRRVIVRRPQHARVQGGRGEGSWGWRHCAGCVCVVARSPPRPVPPLKAGQGALWGGNEGHGRVSAREGGGFLQRTEKREKRNSVVPHSRRLLPSEDIEPSVAGVVAQQPVSLSHASCTTPWPPPPPSTGRVCSSGACSTRTAPCPPLPTHAR